MKKILSLIFILILLSKGAVADTIPNALKRFEVEDLKIEKIEKNRKTGQFYAFVFDPDEYIYRVEVGDRWGRNFGKIKKINLCGIWFNELHEDKNGDWGIVERVMFIENASPACKAGVPKGVVSVARGSGKLASQEQVERNALKVYFDRLDRRAEYKSPEHWFSSTPLTSGIYSFSFDDGWVVVIWDANQEVGKRYAESGEVIQEKKLIFEIFVLNKRGSVVKFGTNGSMPDT